MNETETEKQNADATSTTTSVPPKRSSEKLLCELTSEYCELSEKLTKLTKAIEADPAAVSDYHKSLWKVQADYMGGYKNTLANRIKDILEHN